ncbi:nuclear transport factor 2 family protein [Phreatobacter stygius]|uniref:Nuclear transport factor 2 family protein n=1 Tax=Phreatobacter stygius TaxID=1940610 RepID=A0A4D7AQ79_9HYPH|nr:nuclear transport factor 2 family protein [Phreatobacter stygius]QCI63394.1 nuclear transport factor 2 family protein [Phreatobacter stygius]
MTAETDITKEIRDLEARRYHAMLSADVAELRALLSDALVYTHSNATVDDKTSYIDKVANKYFDYREITRPEERVVVVGATALVVGRMVARVVMEGKTERHLDNRSLAVWAREGDGRWRFVAYQPTPIPKP